MDKLKAMTIFNAVVEEGTMTAAAKRLGIANSVVSKNLNELEAWLGRKLIYRSTRRLNLSLEGKAYYEKIKHIVVAVESLEQPDSVENIELTGVIKITAPVIIGKRLCEYVLPHFHTEFPGIHLDLLLSDDFNDMIEEGIDIALRISKLPDSNFIAKKVGKQTIRLVTSLSYVEQFGAPLDFGSLNRHVCIVDNSIANAKRWGFTNTEGGINSVHIDGPMAVNDAECAVILCEAGVGIAQVPEMFVNESIRQGRLIELLPECALEFDISILYHQKSTGSPMIKSVIEYLVAHIDTQHFL
ncbi:LysR family transcriptional regulator [Shewanella gelidimarina]|uniref:LysR family transcriptional regulator n=1 Tax=Shewanella gelidimarina TaxID=56813 RepID=UPI00200CAE92|nr:LysR family transcriptional regulator [Shewanella gelidimarina]MCL1057503.1 LysR family transcriptional regulator [Shewanella gelidimarina]